MPQEMAAATLQKGQSVIHVVHGLVKFRGIEDQLIAGMTVRVYVFEFGSLTISKPVTKIGDGDFRPVSGEDTLEKVVEILKGNPKNRVIKWLTRSTQYQKEITGGDLKELATAIRDLLPAQTRADLSFSERQLYEGAIQKLADEIAAINSITALEAIVWLENKTGKKFPYSGGNVPAPSHFVAPKIGRPVKPREVSVASAVRSSAAERPARRLTGTKTEVIKRTHPATKARLALAPVVGAPIARSTIHAPDYTQLRETLVRVTAELSEARSQHEASLRTVREEMKRIALEASEMHNALQVAQAERDALQEQLAACSANLAEARTAIAAQEDDLRQVRESLAASEEKVSGLKDELATARSQIPPPKVTKPKPIWNAKWSRSKLR